MGYADESDTLPVFATAAHCGPSPMQVDSVLWFQDEFSPTTALDSMRALIGHEIADSAGFPCLKPVKMCSYADVALNKLTTSDWAFGHVAKPFVGCSPICDTTNFRTFHIDTLTPYYVIDGVHSLPFQINEEVAKIGARTGWTGATTTDTCRDGKMGDYVWPCQVLVEVMTTDFGDSGAPVLADIHGEDSTVTFGGIVIGKDSKIKNTTIFTPWPNITLKYPSLRPYDSLP